MLGQLFRMVSFMSTWLRRVLLSDCSATEWTACFITMWLYYLRGRERRDAREGRSLLQNAQPRFTTFAFLKHKISNFKINHIKTPYINMISLTSLSEQTNNEQAAKSNEQKLTVVTSQPWKHTIVLCNVNIHLSQLLILITGSRRYFTMVRVRNDV